MRTVRLMGRGPLATKALILGRTEDGLWCHLVARVGAFPSWAPLAVLGGDDSDPLSNPRPRGHVLSPRPPAGRWGTSKALDTAPPGSVRRAGAVAQGSGPMPVRAPCSYGDPKQWAAFLGTPFLSGSDGQLERVARIYKHPFYNLYTLDYDVALLELAAPVRRNRLVRPICLPEPAPRPADGARCIITGWGSVREGGMRDRVPATSGVRGPGASVKSPARAPRGPTGPCRLQAPWRGSCRRRPCASSASRPAAATTRCRSAAACCAPASRTVVWTAAP